MAVEGTDQAYVEQVRQATESLHKKGYPIYATQDWHPADHVSFYTNHPGKKIFDVIEVGGKKQVLWPPHCVQETENVKLLLDEAMFAAIVQKGKDKRYDSYSGFQDDGGAPTELNQSFEESRHRGGHRLRAGHGLLREGHRLGRRQGWIQGDGDRKAVQGGRARHHPKGSRGDEAKRGNH